ncbi:pleckstrin homology domain-containing family B member 2-like [Babylonia areolata]|uniref:pleckstrin homology domain-containing family B member 2-like n=1 Tax=Babylonia areolata TaxID=304850 RepID=UPI003FD36858
MNSANGTDIAKAGWLYRQSSVLHRWKRNWFALYRDGLLRYFDSRESSRAEEVYILRAVCRHIKTGSEVRSAAPPEDLRGRKSCMFELEMKDGNHLLLCAESDDDMRAWQYSLEEARTMPAPGGTAGFAVPGYPGTAVPMGYMHQRIPYGGYAGQVISTPPPQVVQTPHGATTIINQAPQQIVYMDDDRYFGFGHRRRHYRGGRGTVHLVTPRYW